MALGKAVAFANLGKRLPPPTVEVPSASPRSKLALYLQEETEDFCHLFLFFSVEVSDCVIGILSIRHGAS